MAYSAWVSASASDLIYINSKEPEPASAPFPIPPRQILTRPVRF